MTAKKATRKAERRAPTGSRSAQAWIRLRTDDPAAVSAHGIVQRELAGGRKLRTLSRWRLFELTGALPRRETLEERLHASTQFYNPHKEACIVRVDDADPAPVGPGAHAILVLDRDDERRPAAERWWRGETGKRVTVREGVVWVLEFEPGVEGATETESLGVVQDRRHGLFCNPHAQIARFTDSEVPLPWITATSREGATR